MQFLEYLELLSSWKQLSDIYKLYYCKNDFNKMFSLLKVHKRWTKKSILFYVSDIRLVIISSEVRKKMLA